MSDGTINIAQRASNPASPAVNRTKIWVDNSDNINLTNSSGISKTVGGVFGQHFHFTENTNLLTLSTITPTIYLSLVTANLPLGTYRLGYNYIWSYDDQNGDAAHFNINDNGVPHLPTDITMETKNIFDKPVAGSFLYLDNISGVHTIDISVHGDDIADIVKVYSAYLELWRVF